MGCLARFVLLCILCVSAVALSESQRSPSQIDREHTEWITGVLNATQTVAESFQQMKLVKFRALTSLGR